MSRPVDLHDVARSWQPGRTRLTRTIEKHPAQDFASIIGQPDPVRVGPALPMLWHWFAFAQDLHGVDLGPDGHPVQTPLMPSFADRRRMYAGGRLRQRRPFAWDADVTRESEVVGRQVKQGRSGQLLFVTVRHSFTQGAETLAVEEEEIVYRQQAPGALTARSSSGREPPAPEEQASDPDGAAPPRIELATDPVALFRFSALTHNAHRIHYDHPYATQVEGFEGLVVHGPLIALAMLEPTRVAPDPGEATFTFRLLRPLFCGASIRVHTTDGSARPTLGPRIESEIAVRSPAGSRAVAQGRLELEPSR